MGGVDVVVDRVGLGVRSVLICWQEEQQGRRHPKLTLPPRPSPLAHAAAEACLRFGTLVPRPACLYIGANMAGSIAEAVANWPQQGVRLAVVTDGERGLGWAGRWTGRATSGSSTSSLRPPPLTTPSCLRPLENQQASASLGSATSAATEQAYPSAR
jgi:hypothetical protein